MKNTLILFSLLLCAFFLAPGDLTAQDMEPKRMENVAWKQVVHIKFHAGKRGKAIGMINDYFMKAADRAQVSQPDMMIEYLSGEWDITLVWNLDGGVDDMTWEISPRNIAWRKALAEIVGSEEAADELYQEYLSLVRDDESDIGMVKM